MGKSNLRINPKTDAKPRAPKKNATTPKETEKSRKKREFEKRIAKIQADIRERARRENTEMADQEHRDKAVQRNRLDGVGGGGKQRFRHLNAAEEKARRDAEIRKKLKLKPKKGKPSPTKLA
jgi:hypothetical protein